MKNLETPVKTGRVGRYALSDLSLYQTRRHAPIPAVFVVYTILKHLRLLLSIQHRSNPTIMDYEHVTIASSKIAIACKSSCRIIDSQTFRGRR